MEFNLNKLIDDVVAIRKYRIKIWGEVNQVKAELKGLLSSPRSWKSEQDSYYCACYSVEKTAEVLHHVTEPVPKSVWLPIMQGMFKEALESVELAPIESDFIFLTEPICSYRALSTQIGHLTAYYIDAIESDDKTLADSFKSAISDSRASLLKMDIDSIITSDTYNDKGILYELLNEELSESTKDWLYVCVTNGSSKPSNHTALVLTRAQDEHSGVTFNIQRFMKKLIHNIEDMKEAKETDNKADYETYRKEVLSLIKQFDVERAAFEMQDNTAKDIQRTYKICDELIKQVRSTIGAEK